MHITSLTEYDKRRRKVILDDGAAVFLLYQGECRTYRLMEGGELSEETYEAILQDVLLPRAKKRLLYALKNGDKTRQQLTRKLRDSFYPEPVIQEALSFLENLHLVDDSRYAEQYVNAMRGKCSRRELSAKLYAKGIGREEIVEQMEQLSGEDEYAACQKALEKRCGGKHGGAARLKDAAERRRTYAYLARKGYSFDTIEHAFRVLEENEEG